MHTEALDLLQQSRQHLDAYSRATGRPALWDLEVLEKLDALYDDGEITVSAGEALQTIVEQAPETLIPYTTTDEYLFWLISDMVHDAAKTVGIRADVEEEHHE